MAADMTGWKYVGEHKERGTNQEVSGSYGRVIQFNDDTLSVYVVGARRFKKLAGHPMASVFTEGDGEGTVHVPNAVLDEACALIGARKKRISNMTLEQRQAARERMLKLREERKTESNK